MHEGAEHVEELVIVRHGESHYNTIKKEGRFFKSPRDRDIAGGLPDHLVPLSMEGERQSREVGERLAMLGPFDAYFDSGYVRATRTLDLILEAFPERERDPAKRHSSPYLREREPGYTYNMTEDEVSQHFPWYREHAATFGRVHETPPGGENMVQVCSRVDIFLNSVRRVLSGKRVLVVTHGRVMLCFRYWLKGYQASSVSSLFDPPEILNCEILRYAWDADAKGFVTKRLPRLPDPESELPAEIMP